MFLQISGGCRVEWFPKTASTALSNGALVTLSSGQLIAATTTSVKHVGVLIKAIASGDSDYASATSVPVLVPEPDSLFIADAASLTAALVGTTMDLTDSVTVNGAADSHHAVTLITYISATKGIFRINSWAGYVAGA